MESKGAMYRIEQLKRGPFMKQTGYAESIIELIAQDTGRDTNVLLQRNAQLSHPDSIIGRFMLTLT